MNYIAQCLEKFRQIPESIRNSLGGLDVLEKIKILEQDYKIELSFLVVLVSIGELSIKDVPEYLMKKYNLSEEDAAEINSELISEVFSKFLMQTNPYLDSPEKIKDQFSKNLIDLLSNQSEGVNINEALFLLFAENDQIQEDLKRILLKNDEMIGHGKILSDNKEVSPTVANWLKDFIKENGSDMFNELVLANYLSSSVNANKLNQSDKNLLLRLLKLYNNLAFFPDNIVDLPVEDWEIIPIDRKKDEKKIREDALAAPSPKISEAKVSAAVLKISDNKTQSTSPVSMTENAGEELMEMESVLKNYPESSLEYKAIKQEISRFKRSELKKSQKVKTNNL